MKQSKILIYFFVLNCILLCATGARAADTLVSEIEIRGNQRVETATILFRLRHQEGRKLNEAWLRDDIQNLYDLGYFDRIHVRQKTIKPGAVRLIYIVRELPVIGEIEFRGNHNFSDDNIQKEMDVKVYDVATHRKIETSLAKVRQKYVQKGYYLAELGYELVPIEDSDRVKLVVTVMEYQQLRVRKILFSGNRVFTDEDLKGQMMSKEGNSFSWMTGGGRYHELMFDQDVQILRLWYLDHGYARVQVKDPQIFISSDKQWVDLYVMIDEGPKYDFGDVNYAGDLLFTPEELAHRRGVVTGELFRGSVLQQEMDRLSDMYGDLGYAFTNVIPDVDFDEEARAVDITFRFEMGPKVTVRRISFVNNVKTLDKVMRREMRIFEGDLYSSSKVKLSERNLRRLGYFADVRFRNRVVSEDTSLMDLEIEIEEQSTGTLTIGAGFSSQDGFVATGNIAQTNFLGSGQTVQLQAQIAGSRTRFQLGYYEPYLFDYPVRFSASAFYTDRGVYSNVGLSFEELKAGGVFRFGYPFSDDMEAGLSYKLEHVWLKKIFNESLITRAENEGWLSSAMLDYIIDTRDNRLRPTKGFYFNTSLEYGGLGGNLKFLKALGNVRWYVPLFLGLVYRSNIDVGAVFSVAGRRVPVSERFVLGGIMNMRGYQPGSIGPLVCAEATRRRDDGTLEYDADVIDRYYCDQFGTGPSGLKRIPFNIGGRYMAVWTTELEYPVIPSLNISVVAFADIGTAVHSIGGINQPSADNIDRPYFYPPWLRASVGWGIRWWSPIGPLRLEFGYPLIRPMDEPAYDAQFAISPTF